MIGSKQELLALVVLPRRRLAPLNILLSVHLHLRRLLHRLERGRVGSSEIYVIFILLLLEIIQVLVGLAQVGREVSVLLRRARPGLFNNPRAALESSRDDALALLLLLVVD